MSALGPLAPDDPRHGKASSYQNHGCRCDACREAHTAYMRERGYGPYRKDICECGGLKDLRAKRCRACEEAPTLEHGTEAMYTHGACRCEVCRKAMAAARRRRRHANPEATRAWDRAYKARRKAQ